MKVRIKSTGEIKKVADYDMITLDTCDSYGTPEQVSFEDVELIQESSDNTNWEQVRIQAAISAMQGLCNSCHDSVICDIQERLDTERSNVISYLSVRMADALIRELKNNKV